MTNELVNIELPKRIVNRLCDEATAIPLHSLMKLTDVNLAIITSGDEDPYAGITVEEFTGGEGLTHVGCALDGVWDVLTNTTVAIGVLVNIQAANTVSAAIDSDVVKGTVCGKCEEAASGAEVIRVRFGACN